MIRPEMRVSEVLQQFPELLEELVADNPALAKLRNHLVERLNRLLVIRPSLPSRLLCL